MRALTELCYIFIVSAKYPRSLHLPWSPGGTSDDKRMTDISGLLGVPIVITEKCDGSNLTYTRTKVFSRSHAGSPTHPSFDFAKATQARISLQISEDLSVFCEYCYAVHSIAYEALPNYSLVFGVRDDAADTWWTWDQVVALASQLGLPTVPVLFRGITNSEKELKALTEKLCAERSAFGPAREGIVVRQEGAFDAAQFSKSLAKWVRKDHVTTNEHWMHQALRVQGIRSF
jgi:RNA ligase